MKDTRDLSSSLLFSPHSSYTISAALTPSAQAFRCDRPLARTTRGPVASNVDSRSDSGASVTQPSASKRDQPLRNSVLPLNRPYFDATDEDAVVQALRSTFVSGDGPECRSFERELADYLGAKHALFTNSCTAALDLAFMVKEFPQGSEVLVPNFTFTSTALAPILNGLKVTLVDVDAESGNIDVDKIEAKIKPSTVAVVPVDYAGNPADMDPINELAERYGLYVVHDTAQSIGATYKGRKTGTLADVSCFSFHGTKNLVVGEGGALVTNDDAIAEKVIVARDKGTDKHTYVSDPDKKGYFEYVSKGNSYVQSNLLAALGSSQLRKLDRMNMRRREISAYYYAQIGRLEGIRLPRISGVADSNWHLFYVLVPALMKQDFIGALRADGVMANTHYAPLHLNRFYQDQCDFDPADFPNSMSLFNSLVRIPMFPGMTDSDAEDVVSAVERATSLT